MAVSDKICQTWYTSGWSWLNLSTHSKFKGHLIEVSAFGAVYSMCWLRSMTTMWGVSIACRYRPINHPRLCPSRGVTYKHLKGATFRHYSSAIERFASRSAWHSFTYRDRLDGAINEREKFLIHHTRYSHPHAEQPQNEKREIEIHVKRLSC